MTTLETNGYGLLTTQAAFKYFKYPLRTMSTFTFTFRKRFRSRTWLNEYAGGRPSAEFGLRQIFLRGWARGSSLPGDRTRFRMLPAHVASEFSRTGCLFSPHQLKVNTVVNSIKSKVQEHQNSIFLI
jgi:hypothetical protein